MLYVENNGNGSNENEILISDFQEEFTYFYGVIKTLPFSFVPSYLNNVFVNSGGVTKRLPQNEYEIILPAQIVILIDLVDGDIITLQYQHTGVLSGLNWGIELV